LLDDVSTGTTNGTWDRENRVGFGEDLDAFGARENLPPKAPPDSET
jgi:hypothetical protein